MEKLFTTVSPVGSILTDLGVPFGIALPAAGLVFVLGCAAAAVVYRRVNPR